MQIRQVLSAIALFAVCFGVLAQPPEGKPGGDKFQRMQQELNLTDEQVNQMREIKAKGGSHDEINAVLTEEQRNKMAEMKGRRGGDRYARMQKELNLSDEQVAKMRELRASGGSREEIDAVMTADQRKQWEEIRAQHRGRGKPQGPPSATAPAPETATAPAETSPAQ